MTELFGPIPVVATNKRQFDYWLQTENKNPTNYRYISRSEQLMGYSPGTKLIWLWAVNLPTVSLELGDVVRSRGFDIEWHRT
jgi:hypothetical protein